VLGKAAGPLGVVFFLNTNFWIVGLNIRYANISSLIIFILVIIAQLLLVFFSHDLSNEFDLKDKLLNSVDSDENKEVKLTERKNRKNVDSDINDDCNRNQYDHLTDTENNTKRLSSIQLLSKAMKDVDVIFLLVSVFVEETMAHMMALLVPVVIIEKLNYSRGTVDIVFIIQLLSFSIIFIIMYLAKLNEVDSTLEGWFVGILFISGVTIVSKNFGYMLNIAILTIALTFVDVFDLNLNVFFSVSLANLVQSKYQSFMESISIEVHVLATIAGSMLVPVAAQYSTEVGCTLIVTSWVILMLTFINRQKYTNIKIKI